MSEPVSVVLIAYNEAEVIESVVRGFQAAVVAKLPGSELIVAEDGSTDGTREILNKLQGELGFRLESGGVRKGYVQAYRDALGLPRREWIFFSDTGGKYDPEDFWTLYRAREGTDMVIGSKTDRRDPWYRLGLSRGLNAAINVMFGTDYFDINSGFRLMRKTAVDAVLREPWRLRAINNSEFTLRMGVMGFQIKEVPIKHFARAHGSSRGVPVRKIPSIVWHVLSELPKIRKELISRKRQGIRIK